MVESADALASGASGSNTVWVQVPSSALLIFKRNLVNQGFSYFFVLIGLIPVDTKATKNGTTQFSLQDEKRLSPYW